MLGPALLDQELDETDRTTGVVVDVDVLDVDPARARVGEQPGQLAGWSGTDTNTERVGGSGAPCLPGIARVPATPSRSRASSPPLVRRRDDVDQGLELGPHLPEQGEEPRPRWR